MACFHCKHLLQFLMETPVSVVDGTAQGMTMRLGRTVQKIKCIYEPLHCDSTEDCALGISSRLRWFYTKLFVFIIKKKKN